MSMREEETLVAATLVLGIAPAAMAAEMPPPSASGFAVLLVSSTTAHAKAHGTPGRIERPTASSRYVVTTCVHTRFGFPETLPDAIDASQLDTQTRFDLHRDARGPHAQGCRSLQDALHSLR